MCVQAASRSQSSAERRCSGSRASTTSAKAPSVNRQVGSSVLSRAPNPFTPGRPRVPIVAPAPKMKSRTLRKVSERRPSARPVTRARGRLATGVFFTRVPATRSTARSKHHKDDVNLPSPFWSAIRRVPATIAIAMNTLGVVDMQWDGVRPREIRALARNHAHRRIVDDRTETPRELDERGLATGQPEPCETIRSEGPVQFMSEPLGRHSDHRLQACQQRLEQSCQQFAAPASSLGM